MAEQVLTDCFLEIDGTDYSGQMTNVAISTSAEAGDVTAMGDGTRRNIGGLKDWSVAAEFNGSESVTGSFFDKLGTVVDVEVRPTYAERSETNPGYVGKALVTEYEPLSGAVGDVHRVSLSLVSAGPLARLTAPDGV